MEHRAGDDTAEPPDASRTLVTEEDPGPSTAAVPSPDRRNVRWDRFLPRRFLRVLLVEHDDSTRQIVSVLLRKCSYQVAAVADGLRAWEILKDKRYKFDLVLTEVMTPLLSGIGLLSKIVNDDACKNIPVIMMSSNDSMGIVFNCMLKGAADFLVKPVRKNELRNLWQHVWRKQCSSCSGNGYENENPVPRKIGETSVNNTASNHVSRNAGNGLETGESSERGGDTQSSCGQSETPSRGVEGLLHETENTPLHDEARLEACKTDWKLERESAASTMHLINDDRKKALEQKESVMSQATPSSKQAHVSKFGDESAFLEENACSTNCKEGSNDLELNNDLNVGSSKGVIDFIGENTGRPKHGCENLDGFACGAESFVREEKFLEQNEDVPKVISTPFWGLSLRRTHFNNQGEQGFQDKHILNHSNVSAFSRYGDKGNHHVCPPRLCIRDREFDANVGAVDSASKEITISPERNVCEALASHQQYGEKENSVFCAVGPSVDNPDSRTRITLDMVYPQPQVGVVPVPIPVGAIPFNGLCTSYGAPLQSMFYSEAGLALWRPVDQNLIEKYNVKHVQYSHSHSEYEHHLNHHNQRLVEEDIGQDPATVMPRIPSSATSVTWNVSNRNDPNDNGSVEDTNATADNNASFETNNVDKFETCTSSVMNRDCNTHREAALTKFRLKRKNRCFEKRVRYYSRKKLAEQRPRLKGQFVRQVDSEPTTKEENFDV